MNPVYFAGWCFFRFFYKTYFRARFYNPERVPLKGPVILACNHASYLDPPLVGSGLRRDINYLAREDLFRFPVVGWVLRNWNSVPVDREGGGAKGVEGDPRSVTEWWSDHSIPGGHALPGRPDATGPLGDRIDSD